MNMQVTIKKRYLQLIAQKNWVYTLNCRKIKDQDYSNLKAVQTQVSRNGLGTFQANFSMRFVAVNRNPGSFKSPFSRRKVPSKYAEVDDRARGNAGAVGPRKQPK